MQVEYQLFSVGNIRVIQQRAKFGLKLLDICKASLCHLSKHLQSGSDPGLARSQVRTGTKTFTGQRRSVFIK
jgi:hypothetical protein